MIFSIMSDRKYVQLIARTFGVITQKLACKPFALNFCFKHNLVSAKCPVWFYLFLILILENVTFNTKKRLYSATCLPVLDYSH